MKNDIKEIYDTLIELVEEDEKQGEEIMKKEEIKQEPLKSNTEVCEEEGYNYQPGKQMPQAYQCGGINNVGKYLRVDTDGYVRPLPGSGGGEGYEPDFTTIGLTSNSELAVVDYISATSVNSLLAGKQDTLTAGEGISIVNNVISATGGSGEPVYVITGRAIITDPTSLERIPITITSPNYYSELRAFYDENGRLPRVVASVELVMGTETISKVEIDMYSDNVKANEIDLQGALVETSRTVSYIEFSIDGTEQSGELSSFALQSKLTEDSEIKVRRIDIGDYFVTESVMSALNNLLTKAVLIDTNQDISGTKTFTSSFGINVKDTPNLETSYKNGIVEVNHLTTLKTDHFNFPNKDGGTYTLATTDDLPSTTKSYLHCIEVLDGNNNINFYLRFINHSNTTYTSWSQVISETKKMWGWGRTNQQAATYHRYDVTAIGDNGTVLFIDEENNTYDLEEVKITTFTDRGCIEL